jgi:CMP-2-keto-3-deoxyoctulosonic acid synthetase
MSVIRSTLEIAEDLEQLRVLEAGLGIQVVQVDGVHSGNTHFSFYILPFL